MSDLISRERAIKVVQRIIPDNRANGICEELKKLPTIQTEIVRCEECKYHYQRNCQIERYFSLNGFCSRGKRREVTT